MAKDSGEVSGGVRDKFRRGFRASYLFDQHNISFIYTRIELFAIKLNH